MEDRLIELETRQAFQEDSIQRLHEALLHQQKKIDELHGQLDRMNLKLELLAQSNHETEPPEPPPPHY